MTIYTVRSGDSLYSIARKYGVTADQLISTNQLANPTRLMIGQALVIPVDAVYHRVTAGQSLYSIARMYQKTVAEILAANPSITDPSRINVGQVIVIPFYNEILRNIDVNGFAYPSISDNTLQESLPYLTYLSIFSWKVNAQGELTPLEDQQLVAKIRAGRVAPMMAVTNTDEDGFSSAIGHAVLTNQEVQDNFIENLIAALSDRNYYGVNIDFEYLYPYDRESYNQFLRRLVDTLHPLGYWVTTAVAPKISADQTGLLYTAHDYRAHGEIVDQVIIMTYEWGYLYVS